MLKVKILHVDRYGFQGRSHHPQEKHVGQIVRVLYVDTYYQGKSKSMGQLRCYSAAQEWQDETSMREIADIVELQATGDLDPKIEESMEYYQVYIGVSQDGELLEFIDHEIEFVSL